MVALCKLEFLLDTLSAGQRAKKLFSKFPPLCNLLLPVRMQEIDGDDTFRGSEHLNDGRPTADKEAGRHEHRKQKDCFFTFSATGQSVFAHNTGTGSFLISASQLILLRTASEEPYLPLYFQLFTWWKTANSRWAQYRRYRHALIGCHCNTIMLQVPQCVHSSASQ